MLFNFGKTNYLPKNRASSMDVPHCKAYVALNFDTLANFENLVETYSKNLTQDLELY